MHLRSTSWPSVSLRKLITASCILSSSSFKRIASRSRICSMTLLRARFVLCEGFIKFNLSLLQTFITSACFLYVTLRIHRASFRFFPNISQRFFKQFHFIINTSAPNLSSSLLSSDRRFFLVHFAAAAQTD